MILHQPIPAFRAAIILCFLCVVIHAVDITATDAGSPEINWGGHLRGIGSITAIDEQSVYGQADTGPYYDGQAEGRLKNEIFLGARWSFQTHYEMVAAGGDTRAANTKLMRRFAGAPLDPLLASSVINDDQRLFHMSRTLVSEDDYTVYHRLDRLNVTFTPSWGSITVGRQALTWGNGMVFNPMDLFNPFEPTAVVRDYKVGDDMLLGQVYLGGHEGQVLYVPRRDPATGDLCADRSSYAGKLHLTTGAMEMDFMAARHYDDNIIGWGASGYLGSATWRLNTVYTSVGATYDQSDFLQIVANMDYAWQWGGKNIYGLLELFYNGLGEDNDYSQALSSPYLIDRLARGELFTIGRYYLACQFQIELHPLLRNDWTCLSNLRDPSGLLLPRLVWDATTNTQLILGAQLHWGAENTEYGGFYTSLEGQTIKTAPRDQIYLWLTYSF
jgi:hypothetical protein